MAASQPRALPRRAPRLRTMANCCALAREASPPPPPLYLSPEGFDLIAEVKLRSPAVGQLRDSGEKTWSRA
jgi:hypothetical protein